MRVLILLMGLVLSGTVKMQEMKPLTPEEKRVIVDKGTEAPFTGKYYNHKEPGVYHCRQCGAALYRSQDKFDSGCGWPSFDDEIPGAVVRTPDADGRRTEITCANCGAHLGHVFIGEEFTTKNTRHCVNSISLVFEPDAKAAQPQPAGQQQTQAPTQSQTGSAGQAQSSMPTSAQDQKKEHVETAIFAGGCFWGVEYMLSQLPGVLKVESGYTGGTTENPTYEQVCTHTTGHAEAVRVTFNPALTSYEKLARLFFEIHDPTQLDGQGPDIGNQYRSEVFYTSPAQEQTAGKLIAELRTKGYDVVTEVAPAGRFWPAEDYHQRYYERKGTLPYCHAYTKRF